MTAATLLPRRIWIESGLTGECVVMVQHGGHEPFSYGTFPYDHRYTSNAATREAARSLALSLGATEPIEERLREWHPASAEDLRKQIAQAQAALACLEGDAPDAGRAHSLEWVPVTRALPDIPQGELASREVLGGFWATDTWLREDHPKRRRFIFGPCQMIPTTDLRNFPLGKEWHTFGPSHSQITHWAEVVPPADD